jgi:RHS repeat-associated protein
MNYDADGNTLTDENGNSYQWDALNRLTKMTYASGASTLFAYDGLSRRIQAVEEDNIGTVTSTKNYLWIGLELAEERDGSNTVTKRFFSQGEQHIVSGTTAPFYYTRDHEGSVREMIDASGSLVSRLSYDIYGRTSLLFGSITPSYQYAGMLLHPESGLYMTIFRFYDPNTGRWESRDPIGIGGGENLYDYVSNSPTKSVDPLGLFGSTPAPPDPDTFNVVFDRSVKSQTGVSITYQSSCCHNVRFMQFFKRDGGKDWILDTPYLPRSSSDEPFPYYPYQYTTTTGYAQMLDQPGKSFPNVDSFFHAGAIQQDFTTCAICIDGGTPRLLKCIQWGHKFDSVGNRISDYGSGNNLPGFTPTSISLIGFPGMY